MLFNKNFWCTAVTRILKSLKFRCFKTLKSFMARKKLDVYKSLYLEVRIEARKACDGDAAYSILYRVLYFNCIN